ncbi:uncharacterized protein LOC129598708 [Paramacrobiotus metropolitanus]|uniref:uncharacterized protein LOC129598708 n=1 Tax=Paramacrobiotus metropolitanus TaxID=2943436 RepID=UPI0024462BE0|nr:uncharacterized protein LOC129598708 [Paramacrobiotus metropolitanus]
MKSKLVILNYRFINLVFFMNHNAKRMFALDLAYLTAERKVGSSSARDICLTVWFTPKYLASGTLDNSAATVCGPEVDLWSMSYRSDEEDRATRFACALYSDNGTHSAVTLL